MHEGESINAWQRYWRSGALHSLSLGADNVGGALGERWRCWFDALPNGSTVVDLAAGNGPLARFALGLDGCRHDPRRRVHAVDLAAVEPSWARGLDSQRAGALVWHGGQALETMAIEGPPVGAWASQFGFEYSDIERTSARLQALSAPHCRAAMLIHHIDSVFVVTGRDEAEALDRLLASDGVVAASERLAPWLAQRRRGLRWDNIAHARADSARQAYNDAQSRLNTAIALHHGQAPAVIDEVRAALHLALGSAEPEARVAAVREAFAATRKRLATLAAAARDGGAMADWCGFWTALGWRASVAPFDADGQRLGWWFEADRGAA